MLETIYLSSLAPKTIETSDWTVLAELEPSPAYKLRVLLHKSKQSILVLGSKGEGINEFQEDAMFYGYQAVDAEMAPMLDYTAQLISQTIVEMGLDNKKAMQLIRKLEALPLPVPATEETAEEPA